VAAPSKLEPYKGYLKERLRAGVWNAAVLLRELHERNYDGGYTILKDWLHPRRRLAESVGVQRFETPVGKQVRVDWGHLGAVSDGDGERKLWGFTMTLGYSRRLFGAAATRARIISTISAGVRNNSGALSGRGRSSEVVAPPFQRI
jgi:transposase